MLQSKTFTRLLATFLGFLISVSAGADNPLVLNLAPGSAVGLKQISIGSSLNWAASPQNFGPYGVGRTTVTYIDSSREDRALTVDVWFPILTDNTLEPSEYDLVFASLPSVIAKQDAEIAEGPFPLLMFSHGSQGIRFQSYFLTETLASHGFIVASPDHAGNTALDLVFNTTDPFEQVVVDRPKDIAFVLSRLLEANGDPANDLYGAIDEQKVGALGHSFGGYTVLAAASGIDTVPADPRIKAIAPFAPASALLTDQQLASIEQTTLILGGTSDTTTPVDDQSTRPFALMTNASRRQVDILDAGHQSFTNICTFSDVLLDAGIPGNLIDFLLGNADEGCAPDLIPIIEAQLTTNLYMVSFFERHLNDDLRFARYLEASFAGDRNLPTVVQFAQPDQF